MPARLYPALDIRWPGRPMDDAADRVLAELDAFAPSAVEELTDGLRVFFSGTVDRDHAQEAVRVSAPSCVCSPLLVSDEAWAERSQAALGPVQIGRIVVAPPWSQLPAPDELVVVRIQPSMGFGTGHHASTRLCLRLLQDLDLPGCSVLDVGTGSGVLGIAAWRLGASEVLGIDLDPDALFSARENVDRNQAGGAVTLRALDVATQSDALPRRFDVVAANLTGAMIERSAGVLAQWMAERGHLVVSGFQDHEDAAVADVLGRVRLRVAARAGEDGWVALRLQHD